MRVKVDSQTIHLAPNSRLCLPPDDKSYSEIYVGNAITDGNKAADLLKQNNKLPIQGETNVLLIEEPIYNKFFMFLGSLFSFYALWWAVIIAWKTVHDYIYIKD